MANDNKGLTPMMRQFFEMKSKVTTQHPQQHELVNRTR